MSFNCLFFCIYYDFRLSLRIQEPLIPKVPYFAFKSLDFWMQNKGLLSGEKHTCFFCFYSLLHIFKKREYAHALARPYCILCINTIPKESLLSIYGLNGWALNGGKDQGIQQISICIILSLISIQMHFYLLFLATHDSPQQALTEGNRTLSRPLQVVRKNHANHF